MRRMSRRLIPVSDSASSSRRLCVRFVGGGGGVGGGVALCLNSVSGGGVSWRFRGFRRCGWGSMIWERGWRVLLWETAMLMG